MTEPRIFGGPVTDTATAIRPIFESLVESVQAFGVEVP